MRSIKIFNDIEFERLPEGYRITDELDGADAVIVRSADLHEIEIPRSVRCIARAGAGTNNIPVEELAERGVVVFNTPGANSNAVKELVIGLLLMGSRNILDSVMWAQAHTNDRDAIHTAEKSKKAFVGRELMGRKIGVVGLGAVGTKVANACVALGMETHGYDPYLTVDHALELDRDVIVEYALDDLIDQADYLTVHVPRTKGTIGLIGAEQLALLAPGALVLNYAREGVIDEDAMEAALESGQVETYITDFATQKALHMPHTLVTPHTGAGTIEAAANCARMALDEVVDYLDRGNITHSVNFPDCSLGAVRGETRIACLHENKPGMIGQITTILAGAAANVQRMSNENAGEFAYTLFDTDERLEDEIVAKLKAIEGMSRVRVIWA